MYDAAPQLSPHALHQDPAFAAALRLTGQSPITLPSGHLLLQQHILGMRCLMLARATPPADLTQQVTQLGLHRLPLLLSPDRPCTLPPALRLAAPRHLLRLDLHVDKTVQRATLHQKWRNQLRRAEDNTVLRIDARQLKADHPVLALEAAQARARRYQNWPIGLTIAFAQAAPDQTHLFTAHLRGYPVAHMVFLSHGLGATYHIGHTTPAGRNVHAHNVLMWHAMCHFAAMGITTLDLGPRTTPAIDRFKRRAGAREHPTGGTWLRWSPLARGR